MSASTGAPDRATGGRASVPPPRGSHHPVPPRAALPSDPAVHEAPDHAARLVRRAWLSLLGFPVSLVAAFVVGEGLFALLGGGDTLRPPLWIAAVGGVPALIVFATPAALAVWFGRRASSEGDHRGYTPALVGAVLVGLFVVQNVLAYFVA